ncbi:MULTISPECIES: lipocalin family protein [Chryseobacterium]|jgi:apolipoprotein D and lipocalin family protein|uniref:lipocalin family protein n=1 Tax=Chryseobacterium TaxID=59732 RepID=UPI001BD196DF|nr:MULTISPECIES: lipocalin family protein [Chryseobacterium]MDR6461992.1 apolipoprotein D and lipocalin family protein [Chryseobacterium sediminis]
MKNRIILTLLLSFGLLNGLISCSSMPEKARPVGQFDVNKYLGTWYEIARFDYRFEKDLDNAIAQYSLNADGNVNVVNSGYNFKKNKWVSANGTAKFRGEKNVAALKVSFFGPFYAGYNVVALEEYKYALVAGKNLDYLWILSREKTIPENIKQKFISKAQEIGYDTSKLIWVKQDKKSPFDK